MTRGTAVTKDVEFPSQQLTQIGKKGRPGTAGRLPGESESRPTPRPCEGVPWLFPPGGGKKFYHFDGTESVRAEPATHRWAVLNAHSSIEVFSPKDNYSCMPRLICTHLAITLSALSTVAQSMSAPEYCHDHNLLLGEHTSTLTKSHQFFYLRRGEN